MCSSSSLCPALSFALHFLNLKKEQKHKYSLISKGNAMFETGTTCSSKKWKGCICWGRFSTVDKSTCVAVVNRCLLKGTFFLVIGL